MKSSLVSQACDSNDSKVYTIYKKWQNNYSIKPDEFLKTIDSSFRHIKLDGEIIYLAQGPFFDAFSSNANKYIFKTYSETIKYDSNSTSFGPEDRIELEELKEIRKNAKKGFENGGNVFFNDLGGFYNDLNFYEKVLMLESVIKDYCSRISLGCCLTSTWLYNYGFFSRCLWDACEERKRILSLHVYKDEIKSTCCYYLFTESWKEYLFKDDIIPSSCFAVCLGNFEMNQQSENGISESEFKNNVEKITIGVLDGINLGSELYVDVEDAFIKVSEGEMSGHELNCNVAKVSIEVKKDEALKSESNDDEENTSDLILVEGGSGVRDCEENYVLIENITLKCKVDSIKEKWEYFLLEINKTIEFREISFFKNKEQVVWFISHFFTNFKNLADPSATFDLAKIPINYRNIINGLVHLTFKENKNFSKSTVKIYCELLIKHLPHFYDGSIKDKVKVESLYTSINKNSKQLEIYNKAIKSYN